MATKGELIMKRSNLPEYGAEILICQVCFRFTSGSRSVLFLGPSNSNSTSNSSRNRLNPQSNDQRRENQGRNQRDSRIEITRNNYIIDDLRNSDVRQHSQVIFSRFHRLRECSIINLSHVMFL